MKTIAIIGTGQGFGYSVAKTFGKQGYNVAMISRSKIKLETFSYYLQQAGINAKGFEGSMLDRTSLKRSLEQAEEHFGAIDVLEYSPVMNLTKPLDVLEMDERSFGEAVDHMLSGAITAVNHVLPAMLEMRQGTLIFTSGLSATTTVPQMDHCLIATAALSKYAELLHAELKGRGVHSALFSLEWSKTGSPYEPDAAAEHLYNTVFLERENAVEPYLCNGF
ncbi:MAG: SDR family NAD(P)-dependent oxidoreductase [Christensenellaceae bacterium]|jgi:NADP-dependent 3-hydroxy acid dehydrogenase YdfG